PIDGRIGGHLVSIGSLIVGGASATTTLLATIVSLDPVHLLFDVSESDQLAYRRAMAAGTAQSLASKSARDGVVTVEARLADERAWGRSGRLDFIDNQIDKGAGTLRMRAVFPNPDQLLIPGQFARIRVPFSQPHPAKLVPDRAVITDQSLKQVMTVKEDGTVAPRPVQLGPMFRGLRVVRGGLSANDSVIIDGLMRARPGARVTPHPGKIEPDPNAD
ncbi:MAG: efflux RND transporter periplasmic adaptor subunit, partial [Rhodospirillaceae bacterium]